MALARLSDLSASDKAAALMMALGEDYGRLIWNLLDDEEVKELSLAMSSLGTVSSEVIEELFLEFANGVSSVGSMTGNFDNTERLLQKMLPGDRVAQIMEEIRGPAGRTMWDKLGNVNEVVLATYLKNEYPQTVAVVMSKIKPEHAASVLSVLPDDFAMEVVMRMLRMEPVQKEILDRVEQTLRIEFMNNLARTSRKDSHETIAEIFNYLDRSSETRFLTTLEDRNRESAERIRALMFTFEDLQKLDATGVQTLLRGIDKDRLGLALKGSSDKIRDMFFSNMSERAAKILKEDMEAMGPVRLKDVDEAQMEIVNVAKDLADAGEIVLADSKGEDELVY
ncbi:flagellar motor switch protein FliG [Emcibacter nanhaiensis]|uniref:Flagellar motor switch protein FliG n=1 Tax=Emcibacter nanhaiensis TaxID=1505037 RepID=A0A501PNE8_9PROT|nr:flagellar motor switch protein FliG [Emcibacter nanhaiensis]TPD62020.1 flagellar motor switch protein FliG [Emcibacter nanhaiensis]